MGAVCGTNLVEGFRVRVGVRVRIRVESGAHLVEAHGANEAVQQRAAGVHVHVVAARVGFGSKV